MPRSLHSPFPASLRSECKKATYILESFVKPSITGSPGTELPKSVLSNAKGIIIITAFRAGFFGCARFGSGIMIARLEDGSWSPPSAIAIGGGGFGGIAGFEMTDLVFILNDEYAVRTYSQMGSIVLGGNVSIAAGPVGRSMEVGGGASTKGAAAIFTYCKTKGLLLGASLEGTMLLERRGTNKKLYGSKITTKELLRGAIPPPAEVQPLMDILSLDVFHPEANNTENYPIPEPQEGSIELSAGAQNQPPSELHSESRHISPVELPSEPPATTAHANSDNNTSRTQRS